MRIPLAIATPTLMLAALALGTSPQQSQIEGRWDAETQSWNDQRGIHLELRAELDGRRTEYGNSYRPEELPGLDLWSGRTGSVQFQLSREAGTIAFQGEQEGDEAWGRFVWTGSTAFVQSMTQLGYPGLTTRNLFSMTLQDVTTAFVTAMQQRGYNDATVRDLIRMRIHGVSPEFVDGLAQAGYEGLSKEDLVRFRIHGVSADYIAAMAAHGYADLSGEALVRFRIHGVSPEYVETMAAAGFDHLSANDIVRMRIHGVSPEFIERLGELGYTDLSAEDLRRARIHGVSADFIHEMDSSSPWTSWCRCGFTG
jgi:hypothetical protein